MGSRALSHRIYLGSVLVFAWLYMAAGSQCTPAVLMAACHGLNVATFLETDILPSSSVNISCDTQSVALSGWSHSPGTDVVTDLLDTSLPKYMANGNTLTITNINRIDEGLYRCIYSNGNTPEQCIYVYGRAVFASCPNDVNGCPGDVSLTVEEGNSVSFNATIIHTPGGSCGFRQQIDTVQLIRRNPVFGVPDDILLSCDTSDVSCGNSKAFLSRGNDPGYEFVFTLNNASLERDNGTFRVSIHVTHPSTTRTKQIEKNFVLQVTPSTDTTATDTEPGVATDATEQRRSSLTIIIGVLVPVVLIIMLI